MTFFLNICTIGALLLLGGAFLCAGWRFLRGPSILDRILAFDVTAVAGAGVLVVIGVRWETNLFLELLLVYTLLGFSSSAAFATYLSRSESSEKEVARGEPTES